MDLSLSLAQLITVLSQIALGAAAYRLARQLGKRVEDHEVRISKLEAK